ncbi:hypothetical protein GS429_11010 [Natronorubrum sp. JWXQ-INN-674]|uniref:Uncharacterized protein n=1 Tax=Natronorubrum halalkaliphilum TaxID=2691917 RepID=A0A6B0VMZ1_9EURY|nr:hypothetical protein [Natronorubrum halalkaliphilum]MXV62583.1 hypothetical protein [Natronorubrum halalkaliphilum]
MESGRSGDPNRDVIVCADVLGSFGVTPAAVRAQRREYRTVVPPGRASDESLESILTDVLADARDRTATVRQTISQHDRGLSCSARYAQTALARELEQLFEAIDWSLKWARTGPAANGRDRLEFVATDPNGRSRETTVTYPSTPLADDNLPAVLRTVDEDLLAGTDATVVLLSAGVDRWRAALVEAGELETLRERYGPRISAFDRPLLAEHELEAYVPECEVTGGTDGSFGSGTMVSDGTDSGPWPAWALERAERRSGCRETEPEPELEPKSKSESEQRRSESAQPSVASLIDEAEPGAESEAEPEPEIEAETEPKTDATETRVDDGVGDTASPSSAEIDGFEIRGGSPTVSRVSTDDSSSGSADGRSIGTRSSRDEREPRNGRGDQRRTGRSDSGFDADGDGQVERDVDEDETEDGFGTLSGTQKTARIADDSFGTDDVFETENDRYRALGAALGAGGAVTVEGLLEDDDFLPELPAVEPVETRIEFPDTFDPAAVSEAKASAEQSGFEWVDSGSLETTRVSNG